MLGLLFVWLALIKQISTIHILWALLVVGAAGKSNSQSSPEEKQEIKKQPLKRYMQSFIEFYSAGLALLLTPIISCGIRRRVNVNTKQPNVTTPRNTYAYLLLDAALRTFWLRPFQNVCKTETF